MYTSSVLKQVVHGLCAYKEHTIHRRRIWKDNSKYKGLSLSLCVASVDVGGMPTVLYTLAAGGLNLTLHPHPVSANTNTRTMA